MNWIQNNNIIAFPFGWQYPVITEQYAYLKVLDVLPDYSEVEYIGFPWATLIDYIVHEKHDKAKNLIDILVKCPSKTSSRRITVSQHIFTLRYVHIFNLIGITDIFCPHTTVETSEVSGIRVHPFPLFPVQCLHKKDQEKTIYERGYLYSFIGAYDNYYLTKVRQWIAQLPKSDDTFVDITREWHFHAEVYENQVFGAGTELDKKYLLEARANKYRKVLEDTVFSLCPSGSGPNSIRLWESLGFGCIPVIISDSLKLPGNLSDWYSAAIFVSEKENAIAELPDLLRSKFQDKELLLNYANAGKRLWQKYGLDNFIQDIVDFTNSIGLNSNFLTSVFNKIQASTKMMLALDTDTNLPNGDSMDSTNIDIEKKFMTNPSDVGIFNQLIAYYAMHGKNDEAFQAYKIHVAEKRKPLSETMLEKISNIHWFHKIDLGNNITTPGKDDSAKKLYQIGMPSSLAGKTVLDIGAWDGFFSFTAEKRGAIKVVSADIATKPGFIVAKEILQSKAVPLEIDVMDVTPDKIGTFDLVLCLGVLYHLKHPLLALEQIFSVTSGQLILETYVDMLECKRPAMAFYPEKELNGDPSNWCGPNPEMVLAMLKTVGFSKAEMYSNTFNGGYAENRAVFHAWR